MRNPTRSTVPALLVSATLISSSLAYANDSIDVDIYQATTEGRADALGAVTLEENEHGVLITTALNGLGPGPHGFHLHENPDCGPATKDGETTPAGAAGGHYDPDNTGSHKGPFSTEGHLGDLPRIHVGQEGKSEQTYLVPRLRMDDFRGRALVIHQGGDNYADEPQPLGGGGARVACGVVPGQ